jgi:hypothetical protein
MARGQYVPNTITYRYILNAAPDVRQVCEAVGHNALREAERLGGAHGEFYTDTIQGRTRFHTRVSTAQTYGAQGSERKWRALRNTIPRM